MDTKKPAIKQVFYLIDPFEVREVLQALPQQQKKMQNVSIPLKSGRCCKDTEEKEISLF